MLFNLNYSLSIICAKLTIGFVGIQNRLGFSPTDDFDELMDGFLGDFEQQQNNSLYEAAVYSLKILFQYLTFPFTSAGSPTAVNNWGVTATVSETFLTFATLLAIFVFFWGVAKSNMNFDRPDAFKAVLGRVLLVVIVIASMNKIYDIVSALQDLAGSFMTEVIGLGGTNNPINTLVTYLQEDLASTEGNNNEGLNLVSKVAYIFTAAAISVGIIKKVIDIIKDCVPVVIEMYVYTWFMPVGLAWLASPETRQKFMSYASGFLGAFFTNVMRMLCIVFLAVVADQQFTLDIVKTTGEIVTHTYHFFQIGDIMRDVASGSGWIQVVLSSQSYGINLLFALGVLELLMRGSAQLAQRIAG